MQVALLLSHQLTSEEIEAIVKDFVVVFGQEIGSLAPLPFNDLTSRIAL
jgi:hypothetical protein